MKQEHLGRLAALVIACLATAAVVTPVQGQETGTLKFELRPYESEVKIKKNIARQLDGSGLRWGVHENMIIIPLVSEKFVKPELPHMTRYGESKAIQLPAGNYTITVIGYEQKKLSRNIDKVLSESAFFNEDVLSFSIEPGATTTLDLLPRFAKTGKLVKVFLPKLFVEIHGGDETEGRVLINARMERSIRWDDYTGPLKF